MKVGDSILKQPIVVYFQIVFLLAVLFVLAVVFAWPFINATNHTSLEPSIFAVIFTVAGIIASTSVLVKSVNARIAIITLLACLIGVATIFAYKEFSIMLEYNEWLARDMPVRFERIEMKPAK